MGVTFHKKSGKYQSQVAINKKNIYIGLYETREEALEKFNEYIKTIPDYGKKVLERKKQILLTKKSYVDERLLRYHILISLAQGFLTKEMIEYIILIVKNTHRKFRYKSNDDKWDCYSYAIENLLKNWHNYNPDRYTLVLPYITELAKRAFSMQWKNIDKHKKNHISINNFNREGKIMNI